MQKSNNKFMLCAAGIFICYLYFGILQEKITKTKYKYETIDGNGNVVSETEKFSFTLSLVFVQCLLNYLVSYGVIYMWPQKEDKTSKIYYVSASTTYLLGMVSSNMALQWIPYPTQVVGKSVKPIPVMIFGVLLGGKSYTLKRYMFVLLIVIGMVLFMLQEEHMGKIDDSMFGVGEMLLVLSLIVDGLMAAVQEKIRAESSPSGHQMMKTINGHSVIFVAIALILTGEAFVFMSFAGRHTYITYNLLALGITQAAGQLFLYAMVSDFGPLAVSIVTTTRKCFTVLISVLLLGNSLDSRQWFGATTVFTGLFLDIFFSKAKAPSKKKEKEDQKKLIDNQ